MFEYKYICQQCQTPFTHWTRCKNKVQRKFFCEECLRKRQEGYNKSTAAERKALKQKEQQLVKEGQKDVG